MKSTIIIKYRAVKSFNGINCPATPWFVAIKGCLDYCEANHIEYNNIQGSTNWKEIQEYEAAKQADTLVG